MSVSGEYEITVHTPNGDRDAHLSLHADGDHLTGEQCTDGHCQHIEHGEVHDAHFEWTSELAEPHATLHFTAQCDDHACSIISGDVDAGPLGSFHFTGKKL